MLDDNDGSAVFDELVKDGGTECPFGQIRLQSLEYIRRRLFDYSVSVPNVLLTLGIAGSWCKASAAGAFSL